MAFTVTKNLTLPSTVTFVSASSTQGTCSLGSGNKVTCQLGTLASGGSATITITGTPQAAAAGTTIKDVAAITSSVTFDPVSSNSKATALTTVVAAAPDPQTSAAIAAADAAASANAVSDPDAEQLLQDIQSEEDGN